MRGNQTRAGLRDRAPVPLPGDGVASRRAVATVIAPEPIASPAALELLGELDRYLGSLYPPEQNFLELPAEEVGAGRGLFLLARLDGEPAGCGAVRLLGPSTAEIKRMYVRPAARGRGLARRLLALLEAEAAALGARRVLLETGDRQAEALALYRACGYTAVPCFGSYAASPSSLCFEKTLGPPAVS
jgi:GNAT superfamily N-acetyltransferase